MTPPRIIVPGATTTITKRTNLRKAFLAPWHPDVNRIWQYALAAGQQKYEVAIHAGSLSINHQRLLVTPTHANLPEFVREVNLDVSRGINALLARERYEAPRELWDSRDPHYTRLMDVAAQVAGSQGVRLICVAAGLVARPEHMPGFVFNFDLWKAGPLDVRRPNIFFSADRPEVLPLEVTPPPLLYEAFNGDITTLIGHMKELEREQIHALRAMRRRGPLGAPRLQRIHPWSEPRTPRRAGPRPAPCFRYGGDGIPAQKQNIEGSQEVRRFRRSNREVRIARRSGELARLFPYGTYKERTVHGAPVQAPPRRGDASIALPGPTLADIKAKLAATGRGEIFAPAETAKLASQTRAALAQDADSLTATALEEVGEFRKSAKDRTLAASRHTFEHNPPRAGSGVKRTVTKRDRRHKDSGASTRHATDPPA